VPGCRESKSHRRAEGRKAQILQNLKRVFKATIRNCNGKEPAMLLQNLKRVFKGTIRKTYNTKASLCLARNAAERCVRLRFTMRYFTARNVVMLGLLQIGVVTFGVLASVVSLR
jgi:hypothetical protein